MHGLRWGAGDEFRAICPLSKETVPRFGTVVNGEVPVDRGRKVHNESGTTGLPCSTTGKKRKGDLQGVAKNLRGVQFSQKLRGYAVEVDKLDSGYVLIRTLADMAHFRL